VSNGPEICGVKGLRIHSSFRKLGKKCVNDGGMERGSCRCLWRIPTAEWVDTPGLGGCLEGGDYCWSSGEGAFRVNI
jgi:hypothetical protein